MMNDHPKKFWELQGEFDIMANDMDSTWLNLIKRLIKRKLFRMVLE